MSNDAKVLGRAADAGGMTAQAPKTRHSPLKTAGTIALAGLAFVYREAARILDERTARALSRSTGGWDRLAAGRTGSGTER